MTRGAQRIHKRMLL